MQPRHLFFLSLPPLPIGPLFAWYCNRLQIAAHRPPEDRGEVVARETGTRRNSDLDAGRNQIQGGARIPGAVE